MITPSEEPDLLLHPWQWVPLQESKHQLLLPAPALGICVHHPLQPASASWH